MTGNVGPTGEPPGGAGAANAPAPAAGSTVKSADATKSATPGGLTVGYDGRPPDSPASLDLTSDFEFDGMGPALDKTPTHDEVALNFAADSMATGDNLLKTLQKRLDGLKKMLQQLEKQRTEQMQKSSETKEKARKHRKLNKVFGWLGVSFGAIMSFMTLGSGGLWGGALIVASLALTGVQSALQESGALSKFAKHDKKGALAVTITMTVVQFAIAAASLKLCGAKDAADAAKGIKDLAANKDIVNKLADVGKATAEGVATAATNAEKAEVLAEGLEQTTHIVSDLVDDAIASGTSTAAKTETLLEGVEESADEVAKATEGFVDELAAKAADDVANVADDGAEAAAKIDNVSDDIVEISDEGVETTTTKPAENAVDDAAENAVDDAAVDDAAADKAAGKSGSKPGDKLDDVAKWLNRGVVTANAGNEAGEIVNSNILAKLNRQIEDIKAEIVDLQYLQKATVMHQKDADESVKKILQFIDDTFGVLADVLQDDARTKTEAVTLTPPSPTRTA